MIGIDCENNIIADGDSDGSDISIKDLPAEDQPQQFGEYNTSSNKNDNTYLTESDQNIDHHENPTLENQTQTNLLVSESDNNVGIPQARISIKDLPAEDQPQQSGEYNTSSNKNDNTYLTESDQNIDHHENPTLENQTQTNLLVSESDNNVGIPQARQSDFSNFSTVKSHLTELNMDHVEHPMPDLPCLTLARVSESDINIGIQLDQLDDDSIESIEISPTEFKKKRKDSIFKK